MKNATHRRAQFAARPLALEISRMFRPGLAATAMLAVPLAFAAPQGGTVTAGQAAIQQNGATTTITQGTQRAAIDWRAFNVGSSETVNFVQPNASSAILNRVVGNEASAIFGRITGNGQVFLINPNGILFGRTAQVDVGSLTASTAHISNANFMAGRLEFNEAGKPGARVENQGSITVGEGGFAALVGRSVANSGTINARLGTVALAAGDAFVLDLYGDKLVNLIVDPAAMNTLTDAYGNPLAASVDHSGQIIAEGGRVQLSVATVKQLVDNLINVSGVVRATSFTHSPGLISLQGDAHTRVAVSGTLDASASGQGDGGKVEVLSDGSTQFTGRILARGGADGGNGGQVEVSAKGSFGFMGDVDVSATHGAQGSLLIDPANLRIGSVTSGDSEISADQIRYQLVRGTSVTLAADQNITVDAEVNGLVTGGGGVAGGGLTLTAGNNLTVNQTIALNDGALNLTATSGTLSTTGSAQLYTGSGAATLSGGAGVDVGPVLSGGAVDIRSANGAVNVRNAIVAASANGSAAPVASLNVDGAGAVSLNGALVQGNATVRSRNAGVSLSSAVIQSLAGNVQVNAGTTLSTTANNVGLLSAGTVSATAGQAIDLGAVISTGVATLTSTGGGVTVHQAVTGGGTAAAGGLTVNAAGPVVLAGVNAGAGGIAITSSSGDITSQGATAGEGGLLSAGGITLQANAGQAGTTASRLNVQATAGNVLIDGNTGVNVGTLLGRGSITLSAAAGGVTTSTPIAADAGTVNASTTARPTTIAITARDAIDMAGAVAGTGGISVDSSAGTVTLRDSSLFSQGPVTLGASGAVSLLAGAGIATTTNAGSVSLTSRGSTLALGNGGIRADGDVNLSLTSQGDISVNSDIQTRAGTIALSSTQGAVQVLASASGTDATQNATLDAGADAIRSKIAVTANGRIEVGEMIAYADIALHSNTSDVVLVRGLGGGSGSTGYGNFDLGYQDALRPTVGRLVIEAPAGSVELNGLNLDGNRLATDTTDGLSVTAFHSIVSNAPIEVNKGDIRLSAGTAQATDGVYLGNNVYSRGWDSVGADGHRNGGDDSKTAYSIHISGKVLGLFDNTAEFATVSNGTTLVNVENQTAPVRTDLQGYLVDVNGVRLTPLQVVGVNISGDFNDPLTIYSVDANGVINAGPAAGSTPTTVHGTIESRDIAKIIISNNTANYQDNLNGDPATPDTALRARLVPASGDATPNLINVSVDTIAGVSNALPASGRFSIGSFAPTLTSLSQTPVSVAARSGVVASTNGIGLKLLGFEAPGDAELMLWSNSVGLSDGSKLFQRFEDAGLGNYSQVNGVTLVNGRFTVTTPAEAYRSFQILVGGVAQTVYESTSVVPGDTTNIAVGSVTYTFELGQGPLQGRATVVSVAGSSDLVLPANTVPTDPAYVAGSVTPWQAGGSENRQQSTVALRLGTPMFFTPPGGQAHDIAVRGALYPSTLAGQPAQAVQTGSAVNAVIQTPVTASFTQGSNGVGASTNGRAADVLLSRVTVDTSASGSFTPTTAGTRVFIFDGLIETVGTRAINDTVGGIAVPGFGAIGGTNNSSAGFAGVGAGFGSLAGGTAGAPSAGAASGQGVGGVNVPAGQSGGGTAPASADNTSGSVPVLPVAGADETTNVAAGDGDVLFGTRASAQADLGRGGSVPGSAFNVFKYRYKLGKSSASSVCAPDSLQQSKPAEGKPERECPAAK